MFTILDNTHQNVIAFRASGKIEKEDYDEFVLDFAVPGMKKEDFSIHLEDDQFTVSSGRKEEEKKDEDKYSRREFSYKSFKRTFTIPESVVDSDKIEARYDSGILHVRLPKKEIAKPRPQKNIVIA